MRLHLLSHVVLAWILTTPPNGELSCRLHCLSTAVLLEIDGTWSWFSLSHNIEKLQLFWVFIMKTRVCVKKNTCNVWKLVWLLTVCTSYPPVIMSLTVTVCQWTWGSNLLPLLPSIPCYHPFYWIPPLSYFCCVMSFIHFPPPYNAHSHSFLSHPSHPLLSLAPMPLSTSTV